MAPGVDGHGPVAGLAEAFTGPFPGMAGLAAPVLEDHQRTVDRSPDVTGHDRPVGSRPGVQLSHA
ncbi:MAG: hypothetical protein GY708_09405 [Actinomycetia bacterium]|nr:hypothetical protein [Actinomycetes bacterium]